MSQIKKLPKKDYRQYVEIVCNAFPSMRIDTAKGKKQLCDRLLQINREDRNATIWGLYRSGRLAGGLLLHEFTQTVFEASMPNGGGGFLGVDLTCKKERVAKELMLHFVNHFRDREYPLASLTPFRPDFYRKMGFGYGSKWYEYRVKPSDIPSGWSKEGVRFATSRDFKAKTACYDRVAAKTHGMFRKCRFETLRWDVWPPRMVLYCANRRVEGYLHFKPRVPDQDNHFFQDWHISEFVYENRAAFQALMAFLRSESDQVNHMVFGNQDNHFHFLPHDPRDHSDKAIQPSGHQTGIQGLGIMYRVLDVARMFRLLKRHDFGGQSCKLKLKVQDSFVPDNAGTYLIDFDNGRPTVKKPGRADVGISMDIAEFSSMVLGVVDFYDLYRYGLAEISKPAMIDKVNCLFKPIRRPITPTQF